MLKKNLLLEVLMNFDEIALVLPKNIVILHDTIQNHKRLERYTDSLTQLEKHAKHMSKCLF